MKLSVNSVYRKFSRKFKRLNRPNPFVKPYSTELVLKVVTALLFLAVVEVVFWGLYNMQEVEELERKYYLLQTYLELQNKKNPPVGFVYNKEVQDERTHRES